MTMGNLELNNQKVVTKIAYGPNAAALQSRDFLKQKQLNGACYSSKVNLRICNRHRVFQFLWELQNSRNVEAF